MHDRARFSDLHLFFARYIAASVIFLLLPACFSGQTQYSQSVLHAFTGGSDGGQPQAGLIADRKDNLYGTAKEGGNTTACPSAGCGVVFELSPPAEPGKAWTETVLYAFKGGTDGLWPSAGLVFDAHGNLYGTTYVGGERQTCLYPGAPLGCGVVFKLSPPASGKGKWTERVIYSFLGNNSSTGTDIFDGAGPLSTLIFDSKGNLYGTTYSGGAPFACTGPGVEGCGTIFELSPPATGNGAWTETVLYASGPGWLPAAGVILDTKGNLYGTSSFGPDDDGCVSGTYIYGCGIVFKLSPPANGKGQWTETALHVFTDGSDGATPLAGLVLDAKGNLYGTAKAGGGPYNCCGVVFQLTPPAGSKGKWTETVVHTFTGRADGGNPEAALVFDAKGHLYGTTSLYGQPATPGSYGGGVAFELSPPADGGGEWDDDILYTFCSGMNCSDGGLPMAGLIYDAAGNLYGTTEDRGDLTGCAGAGCGVVFKLSPAEEPAATTATLHLSPGSIPERSAGPVKLVATVLDEAGPGTPGGSVVFFNGSKELGTRALNGGIAMFDFDPAALAIGSYTLKVHYEGAGLFDASWSPAARLVITKPQTAMPAFSPSPGKYKSAQRVILSDKTPGASIYFTKDGKTKPSPSTGIRCTAPFAVSSTETIMAVATAPNHANSAIATAIYTILKP